MIHPLAEVARDTQIGQGTKVWQFASVIRGARIGENCNIAACAIVDGAALGDECLVGHCASIHPGAKIGNRVFVGPLVMFCNDAWPSVGKEGFDPKGYEDRPSIVVGDDANIGARVVILPGVRIGARAMVAAGVTIRFDVPDDHLSFGGHSVPLDDRLRERMRFAAC